MDYAYELQDEAFFLGPYAPMKIKHAPSHYLKKMYLDTVTLAERIQARSASVQFADVPHSTRLAIERPKPARV